MNPWRLFESPPSDIFSQMALDRGLFEDFLRNPETLPLLRIYRVMEPAVTVGRSWRNFRGGPSVCVRPTGGGRVEHGCDLIYSVIARRDSFPTFHQVRTSYLSFHEAVQEAFQALGIGTRLFRCDEARSNRSWPSPASPLRTECFKEPVATDVLMEEKKIAGGAQWRRGPAFLHQGSIRILPEISFESLKGAFLEAFQLKFGIVWTSDKMTAAR